MIALRDTSLQTACPSMTEGQVITDLIRHCLFNLTLFCQRCFPCWIKLFFLSLNNAWIHENIFVITVYEYANSRSHQSIPAWSNVLELSFYISCIFFSLLLQKWESKSFLTAQKGLLKGNLPFRTLSSHFFVCVPVFFFPFLLATTCTHSI